MITHLLTAGQAVIVRAGGRALTIPGDESYEDMPPGYADYARFNGYVAPRAWQALTGPCDTCHGRGWTHYESFSPEGASAGTQSCPDCVDGSKIIDLVVTDWCEVETCHRERHGSWPGSGANTSCNLGSVSLGRFTIKLLPVVEIAPGPSVPDQVAAEVVGGSVYVVDIRAGRTFSVESGPHDLDPVPVPGRDWVAVLTDTETP